MAKIDDSVKKKVPELRFKGFTDNWEERKLGDLGSVSMNKRIFKDQTSENEEVPFFKIGTFGSKPDAFISRELFEEYKLKYPYPEIGDILISASGSIGRTVEYQGEDEYFQDSNIVWLKHDNRLDNKFLKQFYSIVKWQGLEGSTIKRLYNKNILDTDISIPSPIEQQKIGLFFKQLDDIITLHQRKLDLLKEQKKWYLQKMFPKNGSKIPELRFEGFSGDWEERKLSDIVFRLSKTSNSNQLPKVEFEDIIGGEGRLNKDISNKFDERKGILFEPQDILYGKLRPYLKNWLFSDVNGIALGDFWVFRSIDAEPKFIYSLIQSDKYQRVANDTAGTKMPRSDWKKVSSTYFSIPQNIDEQQKIGIFFKQLDDTITLHQRKLDLLKEQKKGFLQKMFV